MEKARVYNWNRTTFSVPREIFTPKTIGELRAILAAASAEKIRVRVTGDSRHTWGGLSMSTGYAVNMKHFSRIRMVDLQKKTVTVEAGVTLQTLNDALYEKGLALSNMGGIDAQSVGGVVSTATHGSSIYHGTFSDDVLSLEVLAASGELFMIDSTHEHFAAFMTSLGCMGIIISATLQCEDAFYIQQETVLAESTWEEVSMDELEREMHDSHFFQMAVDPHTAAVVYTRRKKVARNEAPQETRKFFSAVASFFVTTRETLGLYFAEYVTLKLQRLFPALTELFIRLTLRSMQGSSLEPSHHALIVGHLDKMGLYVNRSFQDQEYAVPLSDTKEAVSTVLKIFSEYTGSSYAPIILGIRFAKGSAAYLGPSYGRDTCYIDVLVFDNNFNRWEALLHQIETSLYKFNARPHWGKNNFLTHKIITENNLYPKLEEFERVKSIYDPTCVFSNEYMDSLLGKH
jgi:FAD/FMN-containing dehydrogenase